MTDPRLEPQAKEILKREFTARVTLNKVLQAGEHLELGQPTIVDKHGNTAI